eukprot:2125796-Rhodomonas_salina.1
MHGSPSLQSAGVATLCDQLMRQNMKTTRKEKNRLEKLDVVSRPNNPKQSGIDRLAPNSIFQLHALALTCGTW